MKKSHRTRPGNQPKDAGASREVSRLLSGLESQKAELGPIADELLKLLRLGPRAAEGDEASPRSESVLTPSHG